MARDDDEQNWPIQLNSKTLCISSSEINADDSKNVHLGLINKFQWTASNIL